MLSVLNFVLFTLLGVDYLEQLDDLQGQVITLNDIAVKDKVIEYALELQVVVRAYPLDLIDRFLAPLPMSLLRLLARNHLDIEEPLSKLVLLLFIPHIIINHSIGM